MIKTKDLENIRKIEKKIGTKLQQFSIKYIFGPKNGYSCDEEGNIIGFNLSANKSIGYFIFKGFHPVD